MKVNRQTDTHQTIMYVYMFVRVYNLWFGYLLFTANISRSSHVTTHVSGPPPPVAVCPAASSPGPH